ncbi:unnamed protein product [Lactuca saligna]|uniref:Uncharacterized protein n=1 Tax=Lactuca saligna TaxID=75948 RepID=A0AA35Z475_LACSI|nr:unnamed protein product [Lactuca saligna]
MGHVATFHALRYLKTTSGQCLFLPSSGSFDLMAYCDASWLESFNYLTIMHMLFISLVVHQFRREPREKVLRYDLQLKSNIEHWKLHFSKLSLSWLDLDSKQSNATPLMWDNEVALHIAMNLVYHERTKPSMYDETFTKFIDICLITLRFLSLLRPTLIHLHRRNQHIGFPGFCFNS